MKWLAFAALTVIAGCAPMPAIPQLQTHGQATQLLVNGSPYLILGGELHNSSATSLAYMRDVWPRLAAMHMNTVLAAVTWEQVEPVEGQFDFTIVDGLLVQARQHHMHLVLLWFGTWKNGTSRYQPAWVKADPSRFPLVVNQDANHLEILSTFADSTCQADSRAYAALMHHLAVVDRRDQTVLMMQLENEVGVLGDSRDRSPAADAAFASPVPPRLIDYLRDRQSPLLAPGASAGSWRDVFAADADQVFMAWNYARYIDRVAAAGKAEYPIPTYINTWIVQPQDKGPGDYPSGGAIASMHEVWRAASSNIDMLCPDIYLPDFPGIIQAYHNPGFGIFIPESRGGAAGAANSFYAIGQSGAIGFSPFGIDAGEPENGPLGRAYAALDYLAPLILQHQGDHSIAAMLLNSAHPAQDISLGDYTCHAELRRSRIGPAAATGYAILIHTGPAAYLAAGADVQFTFKPNPPATAIAGLSSVQEDFFQDGRYLPGRWLNGDEVQLRYDLSAAAAEGLSGAGIRLGADGPFIQNFTLYLYPRQAAK